MADTKVYQASTTAPVNIAVVKYWGKRDAKLNLPTNSSISVTLSQDDLRTHTTATCSPTFTEDSLLLNGSPQDISNARTQACFRLASSAAGFAALVRAIANLYELQSNPTELSRIARQGSGSACRSLFGGYVAWEMGQKDDGSDSVAVEVAPASHWPTMRALILVVSAEKKGVSSTSGMQITVATSKLFKQRAENVVPQHMAEMERAIKGKDFEGFAKVTMMDMEDINKAAEKIVAAYTFDAGPNAVIYFEEENLEAVAGSLKSVLQGVDGWEGKEVESKNAEHIDERAQKVLKDGVSRVILTGVGGGPEKTDKHLSA
ncbi:hypothetical protein DID88_002010 [Monilinia fructigena]|uniref:Diphosphomevalonate decarboxylase n=1 Tax=Monilinia fructigena TaxID=38457 RepID=A0A395IX22_9HELO|nr:hypothetical protein DID88_002010 [Monilinia fructigena]